MSVLADLPGAIHYGFDGDGTAPAQGELGRSRFWGFSEALETPLPEGVVEVTKAYFDKKIVDREAAKPVAPAVDSSPTLRDRYEAASTTGKKLAVLAEAAGLVEAT